MYSIFLLFDIYKIENYLGSNYFTSNLYLKLYVLVCYDGIVKKRILNKIRVTSGKTIWRHKELQLSTELYGTQSLESSLMILR